MSISPIPTKSSVAAVEVGSVMSLPMRLTFRILVFSRISLGLVFDSFPCTAAAVVVLSLC